MVCAKRGERNKDKGMMGLGASSDQSSNRFLHVGVWANKLRYALNLRCVILF
jgi:hypothetical protein